jgi:hypothetical protein
MPVTFPSLQLIFALLILSPGFITVRLVKWRGKVTKSFDRFDKIIYTVIASGASLSMIIISYSLINSQLPSETINTDFQLWQLSVGFVLTTVLSGLVGFIIGWVSDERIYKGIDTRKDTVWKLIFDNSEEPREVRVITTEGSEVHGYIYVNDSDPHGQDLLLKYPQKIMRDGGKIDSKESIGDYVFISQADISHIYFESEINV